MTSQTNEAAFESTVKSMLLAGGWNEGDRSEWDAAQAIFPARVVAFLQATQPETWAAMAGLHGENLEARIVDTLAKELDLKGTLDVLRHGFKFYGKTFRLAHFKPAHGLNPEALAQYECNQLTVTRQVAYNPRTNETVDLVFALNGLPVATCELKNPMTGQTYKSAIRQYKQNRDPNAPIFKFQKRALVHFAADPDEVHMTTRLAGEETRFLPFNRGSQPGDVRCGAGNPPHASGYRTGYFWQEVLKRERFLDILGSYMFVERREEKVEGAKGARTVKRETVIFPRYHQLDSVDRLVTTAAAEGPGHNYLIQHSAGSGKTNSISWLSHRLASLHDADDEKIYSCVVVITDRRVLDRQLQDAIYQIEHAQGVVKAIDQDSHQLANALVDGTMIVITTLQKFPFVMRGLLRIAGADEPDAPGVAEQVQAASWRKQIAGRRYAVIVDEAHSSQTGESAREMKAVLGSKAQAAEEDEAEDWEDGLNAVIESRGPQPNLSFFAFTATPKGKTLEVFGRKGPSGKPEPFHVYSMRQAIEEKFILDVLRKYTDYDTYYRLVKQAADDPEFPKRRAASALAKFMQLHPHKPRAEDRSDCGALSQQRAAPDGRQSEGDGGDFWAATRGALHAGVSALHRREEIRRRTAAGGFQRHGAGSGHGRGIHRAEHEPRRGNGEADQRISVAGKVRIARLPDSAGGGEVPDGVRSAAAAGDVRGQASGRGAGGADALTAEPHGSGQGASVRAGLRE